MKVNKIWPLLVVVMIFLKGPSYAETTKHIQNVVKNLPLVVLDSHMEKEAVFKDSYYLNVTVKNNGRKVINAFKLKLHAWNAYGEVMKSMMIDHTAYPVVESDNIELDLISGEQRQIGFSLDSVYVTAKKIKKIAAWPVACAFSDDTVEYLFEK
jgi:hypothetical protein